MAVLGEILPLGGMLAGRLISGVGIPPRGSLEIRTGLFDPRYDPRVKEKERVEDLVRRISLSDSPTVDEVPLSYFEGRPYVTSMADRSFAGGVLTGINDVPIAPVPLQGGQGYMFRNPGQVWASAPAITRRMHQGALAGGEDTAAFFPFRMGPTGGDYAEKTGRTMMAYDAAAMNKRQKRDLNRAIKKEFSAWPGIDSEKANDFLSSLNGPRRSRFLKVMDSMRNDGGLSLGEARVSVVDPEQLNATDFRLMNVGEIDTTSPLIEDSGHITYKTGLPGEGIGRLRDAEKISPFDLEPASRTGPIRAADPLNPTLEEMYTLRQQPEARGVITPEILKRLQDRGVDVGALAGAGILGAGALAPEEAEAGPISKGGKTILEAWHGSPHRFDKFSMDKIGTGEGAQAYGHGLYFADSEGVARGYRDALSQRPSGIQNRGSVDGVEYPDLPDAERKAMDILALNDWDLDNAITSAKNIRPELTGILEDVKAGRRKMDRRPGALYRVNIDVDPDTMLDYDLPLSEQPQAVQEALSPIVDEQRRLMSERANIYTRPVDEIIAGRTAGEWLDYVPESGVVGEKARPETVSAYLNERGIPGIRYSDAMSRNQAPDIPDYETWRGYNKGGAPDSPELRQEYAGEVQKAKDFENSKTYNYVMFDDKPINIVERGSADPRLLGALATGALSAALWPLNPLEKLGEYEDMAKQGLAALWDFGTTGDVAKAAETAQRDPWEQGALIGEGIKGESPSAVTGALGEAGKWLWRLGGLY
jgi:hypothetical protein